MKLKLFTLFALAGLLLASSGTALAQGSLPPVYGDDPISLPKRMLSVTPVAVGIESESFNTAPTLLAGSITNGNFEQGNVGWSQSSSNGYPLILPIDFLPLTPHSGTQAAWLGGDVNEVSILTQSGILIANPASILRMWYLIGSQDNCGFDFGYVKVNGDTVHTWNLCNANNNAGWVELVLNLGAYDGQTITLSISAVTNSNTLNSNLFIDDVYLGSTFSDVPNSHPYYEDIEILYANGLTAGCVTSPPKFCPDQIMDRAQSAVFMLRGSLGVSYEPPAVAIHIFADNWAPGPWAEKWAEGMYLEGLTAGCTASGFLKFCPWDLTPREQAAIFGLRLKYGNHYSPPPATGALFADMTNTSYYATKWAEQAYIDGLIPACGTSGGKPMFCPMDLVSRGLGAYIIVRAKNLSMP